MEKIKELLKPLFAEYDREFAPATEKQISGFIENCKVQNVPAVACEQLLEFYRITNGVPCLNGFIFHQCDDDIIFEWWDDDELWLGACNDDVLRWTDNEFCLGDASNASYTHKHKFDTLADLLKFAIKEWDIL